MFGTVTFSFLPGRKIKGFVLGTFNESLLTLIGLQLTVSNFSSLFMMQDISEGHLLSNNKLLSPAKWWTTHFSRALLTLS